jgi:FkbM family methyltransferase
VSLKSKLIEYSPDWLFAQVYSRINKRGIGINYYPIGRDWIVIGDKYYIYSPTAKFTSVSMKEFEDKFEKYFKIEQGDICIDVGACIGDTTVPMCIKTGKYGFVYAVEPNKLNIDYLDMNLLIYKNTKILKVAVWNKKGHLTFHEHSSPTGHSLIPLSLRKKETQVETDTLDNLFKGIVIDFAKIDVQSAEVEVLSGATEFLSTTRKLVIECHHDYKDELHDTSKEIGGILDRYYDKLEYSKEYNLWYAWR